jgi:hypothetical protein
MEFGSDHLFSAEELTFDVAATDRQIRFVFQSLSGTVKEDTVTTSSVQGWVIITDR